MGHQHSAQAYLAGSSFVYSFSQHKMYFDVRRSLRPLINSLLAHDFYSLRAHRRLNGARELTFPMNRVKSQPWNCFRLFFSRRSPSQSLRTILLEIRSIKTADNTRVVFTASHFLIIFTQAFNLFFVTSLRSHCYGASAATIRVSSICFHGHSIPRHFGCYCALFKVRIQTKLRYFSPVPVS